MLSIQRSDRTDEIGRSGQQYSLPTAFCEICKDDEPEDETGEKVKVRAICECLNCNMAMCAACSEKHLSNNRLRNHKILSYKIMLVNGYSQIRDAQRMQDKPKERSADKKSKSKSPINNEKVNDRISRFTNKFSSKLVSQFGLTPKEGSSSRSGRNTPQSEIVDASFQQKFSPLLLSDTPTLEYRTCQHHSQQEMNYYSISKR